MVRKYLLIIVLVLAMVIVPDVVAMMVGKEAHDAYLYPTVRVSVGSAGGSGTIIYSKATIQKT